MNQTFHESMPILDIDGGFIISKMGDFTAGYELTKREIFGRSQARFSEWPQAWAKAIASLSTGCVLHLQDYFVQRQFKVQPYQGQSMLDQASDRHFDGRAYLEHRSFLFITKRSDLHVLNRPRLSSLLRTTLVPELALSQSLLDEFMQQLGQFEQLLSDSGAVGLRRLEDEELAGTDDQAGVIEQYCQLSFSEKDEQPEIRELWFSDGLQIGANKCILYTIADASHCPANCSASVPYAPYSSDSHTVPVGFASCLGPLLACNHIYNQYLFLEDPRVTVQELELKRRRLQSLSAHSRENVQTREAVDACLNELAEGRHQLVRAHFNIIAWADNPATLDTCKKKVASAIAQTGSVPHLETICAPQIWWAGIPGNAADMPGRELFDTFVEQAACFLTSETNYQSCESPTSLRMADRITGKPVSVDIDGALRHVGMAINKLVIGGSGSGKSFFLNHLIRNYYEQGNHIVIVDIGNSYQGLCKLVDGYYFSYSEENPIRFNPFWLGPGEVLDTEKRESIKTLLLVLWKKDDEAFLRSEYVALSFALQLYYEMLEKNKDVFPCFDSFYAFLSEDFTELVAGDRLKVKDFDIDNFLYVLRPFRTGGEFGYLLNARENLDLLQQRLVVFELDNLKDHEILYAVATIVIMLAFINKMRKLPGIRKTIVLEEVWKALTRQGMSEYIRYLVKTVRKFNGDTIMVCQEVDDTLSSPIVKSSIVNNSDCKILLDQSKFRNRFGPIQELLGMTDDEVALALSMNRFNEPGRRYKEVYIMNKVYRTEVSPEEYYCYTTAESEKVMVQEYAARYGSYEEGIRQLVNELNKTK